MRFCLSLVIVLACSTAGAAQERRPPAPADLAFFEAKVRPILAERCFSCHSTKAKKTRGGLALDSRERVLEGGDSGPIATAGKPDESRLVEAISHKNPKLSMPPTGKLPDGERAILVEWVRRGLPYPETGKKLTRPSVDVAEGRKFWSFQPVRRTSAPPVKRKDWVRKPLTRFSWRRSRRRGWRHPPRPSAASSSAAPISTCSACPRRPKRWTSSSPPMRPTPTRS
ncbi:MAG: c-type cytochrome domain-containing protein [Gemmataceae bacterium]